jgi:hypothetical protein
MCRVNSGGDKNLRFQPPRQQRSVTPRGTFCPESVGGGSNRKEQAARRLDAWEPQQAQRHHVHRLRFRGFHCWAFAFATPNTSCGEPYCYGLPTGGEGATRRHCRINNPSIVAAIRCPRFGPPASRQLSSTSRPLHRVRGRVSSIQWRGDALPTRKLSIGPIVGRSRRVSHGNNNYVVTINPIDDAEGKPPHEIIAVPQIT